MRENNLSEDLSRENIHSQHPQACSAADARSRVASTPENLSDQKRRSALVNRRRCQIASHRVLSRPSSSKPRSPHFVGRNPLGPCRRQTCSARLLSIQTRDHVGSHPPAAI